MDKFKLNKKILQDSLIKLSSNDLYIFISMFILKKNKINFIKKTEFRLINY